MDHGDLDPGSFEADVLLSSIVHAMEHAEIDLKDWQYIHACLVSMNSELEAKDIKKQSNYSADDEMVYAFHERGRTFENLEEIKAKEVEAPKEVAPAHVAPAQMLSSGSDHGSSGTQSHGKALWTYAVGSIS